jgi:hypothetical protein
VEHFFRLNPYQNLCFLILATLCLVGASKCEKPEPNPEGRDPIYQDLAALQKSTEGDLATESKKLDDLDKEIGAMKTRDSAKLHAMGVRSSMEKRILQMKQMAQYYEIRATERKAYDEKDYLEAFNAERAWPDPATVAEYQARKKLRNASRNWEDHVPKSTRYMAKPTGDKKAEKKEGGEKKE